MSASCRALRKLIRTRLAHRMQRAPRSGTRIPRGISLLWVCRAPARRWWNAFSRGWRAFDRTGDWHFMCVARRSAWQRRRIQRAAAANPEAVGAHYARLADPGADAEYILEKLPAHDLPSKRFHGTACALLKILRLEARSATVSICLFLRHLLMILRSWPPPQRTGLRATISALASNPRQPIARDRVRGAVRDPQCSGSSIAAHCGLAWSDAAIHIRITSPCH